MSSRDLPVSIPSESWDYRPVQLCTSFYMGTGDPNMDLYACTANSLLTAMPSPELESVSRHPRTPSMCLEPAGDCVCFALHCMCFALLSLPPSIKVTSSITESFKPRLPVLQFTSYSMKSPKQNPQRSPQRVLACRHWWRRQL